jgi:hypothetical protein
MITMEGPTLGGLMPMLGGVVGGKSRLFPSPLPVKAGKVK